MKLLKPFRGLRPAQDLASQVASHPYDVVNRQEARALAQGNPNSFFHINKPEIDLPDAIDAHDDAVYSTGKANLQRFINEEILVQDAEEKLYVYKQIMGEHEQVGLVAVASVDAYENGLIKKHEFTRPEKEDDRVNHMDALGAQVGPVFLTYKARADVDKLITKAMQSTPEYDFQADDNTQHVFWVIEDLALAAELETSINRLDCLYVADGHHRSAAASRVRNLYEKRNENHQGDESYNWFLVVVFPDNQMQILDYNRIIKDANGLSKDELLKQVAKTFDVSESSGANDAKPTESNQFGLYFDGRWYKLAAKQSLIEKNDPVKSLDVSILQDNLLEPVFGIVDQRTDKRIDFVGGIRGLQELEKRVDSGEWALAIALFPTSISSLMAIADAGEVMPPKSTWFEPKLKSGLIVHMLD
jgi:uncharacterized protein (DUF1015 family)